jgi:hypothetical protein
VPDFVVALAIDRNLFGQLKSANALIGIREDYPIARPKISILAQPVGGHEKALWARTEVCFPAIGGRSLCRFAQEAHVVREHHLNIKRLDFEFELVA